MPYKPHGQEEWQDTSDEDSDDAFIAEDTGDDCDEEEVKAFEERFKRLSTLRQKKESQKEAWELHSRQLPHSNGQNITLPQLLKEPEATTTLEQTTELKASCSMDSSKEGATEQQQRTVRKTLSGLLWQNGPKQRQFLRSTCMQQHSQVPQSTNTTDTCTCKNGTWTEQSTSPTGSMTTMDGNPKENTSAS